MNHTRICSLNKIKMSTIENLTFSKYKKKIVKIIGRNLKREFILIETYCRKSLLGNRSISIWKFQILSQIIWDKLKKKS